MKQQLRNRVFCIGNYYYLHPLSKHTKGRLATTTCLYPLSDRTRAADCTDGLISGGVRLCPKQTDPVSDAASFSRFEGLFTADMSGGAGTPYIGSKISLVSKAQIRYEGILSSVDTDRSTIALAKVKSYGTEDRHADRPVPAKDEVYEYIIFRGSDIKDITVSEPPKMHHGLPRDPAIVQSSIGSSSAPYYPRWSPYRDMMPPYNQLAASSLLNQQYNAALGLVPGFHGIPARRAPTVEQAVQTMPLASVPQRRGKTSAQPQSRQPARPTQQTARNAPQLQKENAPANQPPSQPTAAKIESQSAENQKQKQKQGSRRSKNQSRGQLLVKNSKTTTLQFESDFDFETANAQFKDDLTKEVVVEKADSAETPDSRGMEEEEEDEETLGDKYYNKAKCFFDNISSGLKPRRITWAEEKKLNMETFGVPGRFLRGRGFRGRGPRGQSTAEQRPLPKVGSGRV
ncbi:protein LSM14 homolog B-like [Echeneis naucrates]|uniref:protein LSM14 homolog B-like n=1 Tax=Echeneis naucrates TaxID=173247 RepID=UPI0011134678|nr:protein LSM14 homolog B-like [Echeneis naucrates]